MKEKREVWTIMIGQSKWDAEYYKVFGNEKEVAEVAWAFIRYWEHRDKLCACVAKRGYYVSFNDFDEAYCDCM